jgi:hypothetical protein
MLLQTNLVISPISTELHQVIKTHSIYNLTGFKFARPVIFASNLNSFQPTMQSYILESFYEQLLREVKMVYWQYQG